MKKTDLILLHAPSVYDFRTKPCLYGPISDVIPSGPIFEMYPIGFLSFMGYLEKRGFSVRIINLAVRMLKDRKFDAEKLIRSLDPVAFGIDLHWLPHAHGSIEIARIIKKYHPSTPVIFGGLSSSYFHEELLQYPQVDYVIRGDSTEEPLRLLLEHIRAGTQPDNVPNLSWRKNGEKKINDLTYSPDSLDNLTFDYASIIRSTVRHRDLRGHLPFNNWLAYPIFMAIPWRGCAHNCAPCGGSCNAYDKLCGRKKTAYRTPALVARDIREAAQYLRGPVFLLGDIRQAGDAYAFELFDALGALHVRNQVALELFAPAPRAFFEHAAGALRRFNLQISPESHDESIRRTFGRNYTNAALEQTILDALDCGCQRVDLFFMTGLPGQTPDSVDKTIDYCEELIQKFAQFGAGRVIPFISPLAPFIDPGSTIFENPEKFGYTLYCRTLEDHRQALLQPSWKYMLSYETQWMNRSEIVDATYNAATKLNLVKKKHGIIKKKTAQQIDCRIALAKRVIADVDTIMAIKDATVREEKLKALVPVFAEISDSTLCRKTEMNWPVPPIRFNPLAILRALLRF